MYINFAKPPETPDESEQPLHGEVAEAAGARHLRLGDILVDAHKLSRRHLKRGLRLQAKESLRLGEALVKLRLITREELHFALASQYSYPCLAEKAKAGISEELVAAYRPFSREAEAFRDLRSQLLLRWWSGERKTLAVVSPDSKEGRSYVTANLAVVFAQMGKRTLLVDADLRTPRQDTIFGFPLSAGLAGTLSAAGNTDDIAQPTCLANLSVAASGSVPPNPLELLCGSGFDDWLKEMATRFDVVLVDTPAAAAFSDATVIGARSGGALMLTRKDHTSSARARDAAKALANTGTQVVGAILNRF